MDYKKKKDIPLWLFYMNCFSTNIPENVQHNNIYKYHYIKLDIPLWYTLLWLVLLYPFLKIILAYLVGLLAQYNSLFNTLEYMCAAIKL